MGIFTDRLELGEARNTPSTWQKEESIVSRDPCGINKWLKAPLSVGDRPVLRLL